MLDKTQPGKPSRRPLDEFQAVQITRPKRKKRPRRLGCSVIILFFLAYFVAPLRTNILMLGVDDSPDRVEVGRTDTIILTTVVPFRPYVGLLGIPRDLWLTIPGIGEQRINTAYFFAEANAAGTGASAAVDAIRQNFGVTLRYYLVFHMAGVVEFVDTLNGVDILLENPMGGLPAGVHHLDGNQALAFVRERYSSSDFSRMQQGQILILAVIRKAILPRNWIRIPGELYSLSSIIDTNIPVWQWPRLGFAFMRAALFGLDTRTISFDMVIPFQTTGGAQVLAPQWDAINPILYEMFGE